MGNLKQRLAAAELRGHGGVILDPNASEPVIKTPAGYQWNGLYFENLRDLDAGTYRIVGGEPVSFEDYWESGRSWADLVEARP